MTVFSDIARFGLSASAFTFLISLLLGFATPPSSAAEDRMAGSQPQRSYAPPAVRIINQSDTAPFSAEKTERTFDLETITYGTLRGFRNGALSDETLWKKVNYEDAVTIVNDAKPLRHYGVINQIMRRALLSEASPESFRRFDPNHTPDYLAVRLNMLITMGLFEDAAKLYSRLNAPFLTEDIARTGVIAYLLNRQPAPACLDIFALQNLAFEDRLFWLQMLAMCQHLFLESEGQISKKDIQESSKEKSEESSKILEKIRAKKGFRYPLHNLEPLSKLDITETAWLVALGKFDVSNLALDESHHFSAFEIAILFSTDIGEPMRIKLHQNALDLGLVNNDKTLTYLKDYNFSILASGRENLGEFQKIEGMRQLAYLYQSWQNATGEDRIFFTEEALRMHRRFPSAWIVPFAVGFSDIDPAKLKPFEFRSGLHALLQTELPWPKSWQQHWQTIRKESISDLLLEWALLIKMQSVTDFELLHDIIMESETDIPDETRYVLGFLREKLDITKNMIQIPPKYVYENKTHLTERLDYVMHSSEVLRRLRDIAEDKAVAEFIFTSSVALHRVAPSRLSPGLAVVIHEGLSEVGLTGDSRRFLQEYTLGLRKTDKKEN